MTNEYSKFRAGKEAEIERLELQARAFEISTAKQISLLKIKSGTDVLDAGCGTGSFARAVSILVRPKIVSAVDIDPTFIEAARRLSSNASSSNIDFKIGDIHNLEYPDGSFDVSYCNFVLPHLTDPVKGVSELVRVTKKGGCVASVDQAALYIYPPGSLDKFFDLFAKLDKWREESNQDASSNQKRETTSVFNDAGLKDIATYPIPTFASSSENPRLLKDLVTVPRQMIDLYKNEVIVKGFMEENKYREDVSELERWLERSDSFWMVLTILTVGVVTN